MNKPANNNEKANHIQVTTWIPVAKFDKIEHHLRQNGSYLASISDLETDEDNAMIKARIRFMNCPPRQFGQKLMQLLVNALG